MKHTTKDIIVIIALLGFFFFAGLSFRVNEDKHIYMEMCDQKSDSLITANSIIYGQDTTIRSLSKYIDMQNKTIVDLNLKNHEYIDIIDNFK